MTRRSENAWQVRTIIYQFHELNQERLKEFSQISDSLKIICPEGVKFIGWTCGLSYNVYFFQKNPTIEDPRNKIVVKVPINDPIMTKQINSPERTVRLWNEANAPVIKGAPFFKAVAYGDFVVLPFIDENLREPLTEIELARYVCIQYLLLGRILNHANHRDHVLRGAPSIDERKTQQSLLTFDYFSKRQSWLINTCVCFNFSSSSSNGRRGSLTSFNFFSPDSKNQEIKEYQAVETFFDNLHDFINYKYKRNGNNWPGKMIDLCCLALSGLEKIFLENPGDEETVHGGKGIVPKKYIKRRFLVCFGQDIHVNKNNCNKEYLEKAYKDYLSAQFQKIEQKTELDAEERVCCLDRHKSQGNISVFSLHLSPEQVSNMDYDLIATNISHVTRELPSHFGFCGNVTKELLENGSRNSDEIGVWLCLTGETDLPGFHKTCGNVHHVPLIIKNGLVYFFDLFNYFDQVSRQPIASVIVMEFTKNTFSHIAQLCGSYRIRVSSIYSPEVEAVNKFVFATPGLCKQEEVLISPQNNETFFHTIQGRLDCSQSARLASCH